MATSKIIICAIWVMCFFGSRWKVTGATVNLMPTRKSRMSSQRLALLEATIKIKSGVCVLVFDCHFQVIGDEI